MCTSRGNYTPPLPSLQILETSLNGAGIHFRSPLGVDTTHNSRLFQRVLYKPKLPSMESAPPLSNLGIYGWRVTLSSLKTSIGHPLKSPNRPMPLQSFRVATQPKKPGQLTSLTVDQTKSWAFFDGACQRPQKNCGLGFCIFFNPTHFITGKANIGKGTNNIV